ncbi:hypothetical protein NPX13_g1084 [Xylaria arbuscula]|uniref:Uncharacterized protein n=1 Tax=Xylaria arbuscula TaxID=114810 RepID=A0A9W8NN37_9PEZI|nr:hypothetical protein NPX13_g1084 [Xylaria arbuscula]
MPPRARSSKSNTIKTNKRILEDDEWLINKIQQKWGIRPTELFPEQSCRHPRVWNALLLNDLVKLAEVASLEQVKQIFERYRSPITNQTIIDARTECLRSRSQAQLVLEQPHTPGSQTMNTQDVVFVASEPQPLTSSFTPANGVRRQSRLPNPEACVSPTNFAELMGQTPQAKRRKLHGNEIDGLEDLALPDMATATSDPSQLVINGPLLSDDSPGYARAMTSFVMQALQSFEKQYDEQYHQVEETSCHIKRLNTEYVRLLQRLKQLEEDEGLTRKDIMMFEDGIRSMRKMEEDNDKLAATLQARLQARKSTGTPNDDSHPISQHNNQQGHTATETRGSHKWSVELRGLQEALATTKTQKDATQGEIVAINSDIVTKGQQLEEEKDTLARRARVIACWTTIANGVTKLVTDSGIQNI